ncbi:HNH endonuclease [Mycobacterium phage Jabbawokkie]|uniref:HNH endonuclease n=1 Tax=Mycobacterium phage Zapner TaxID=1486474 RepID=A0A059VGW3_9CAUD|nr:HNH endonuclease [Mycobacterium phage Jabbawokkie]YP_009963918.1 HNH endonuclease [Mycobacterium phage Zapner]AGT12100.1 HNH endonuclease [Mycobacterium phage Jabbawokkie]AHZ95455.1 HNH endonuclease [Mycobacterium phage Zapner]
MRTEGREWISSTGNRRGKRPISCEECSGKCWKSSKPASDGRTLCRSCRFGSVRRSKPTTHWSCANCGVACQRVATRGQRPRLCAECRTSDWISKSRREAIYERDLWTCWLCEEHVDANLIGSRDVWRPSLDHVIPRASGGDHSEANLRLAHMWCNVTRGDGRCAPEDFRNSV